MPKTESLDELFAQRAAEFADQIRAAALMADKEEEIRIEVEKQLAFIQKDSGVKLEGRHEFTVAQGRADSVYQRVIIEYKNPKSPGARIGPKGDSAGTKKVVEQLKNRFYDMQNELGHPLDSMFGVGLDGNYFVFVRYRDNKWQPQEPVEVNKYSAERFLWALHNLGQKGKPFSSEYLAGDFGSDSPLAQDGVRILYKAISTTDHPKAQVFFNQWKILFGEVCGYDVDNPSDKIKKLAEFYGIEHGRQLKPAELLFAVHSYYGLFMKLLASEIVAYFNKWIAPPIDKMLVATSSNALRREMEDLEAGSVFRHLNITNFLEGDLFSWYTAAWSEPIEHLIRSMVARLDHYNPGTLSEEPASSRDLLKKLYQQLFPKSVRHDLGEYYTPDWLAEHVLNELEYVGDPNKRLLDPACGSGTFLVMAINRIRSWYDEHREQARFDEGDLCRKLLRNVVGFDLNPLAVMAARTNYLIAIRDLVGHVDKVEIPVYLCDSIVTPSEHGKLFGRRTKELKTAAATFVIPTEIATNKEDVAKYAQQLEFCIRNSYSAAEFIERCNEEGISTDEKSVHVELYEQLQRLDEEKRNGIWARIIKNSFAPLFVGIEPVDYLVGNPPWIRWNYLPGDYRADISPLWQYYGLFAKKGFMARLATAELDFSMLYVYACVDNFLRDGGDLGFVITLEVFKSKGAGEGFRRFRLGVSGPRFSVTHVDDMVSLKPFHAANKTSVMFGRKGSETSYPVSFTKWSRLKTNVDLTEAYELEVVRSATARLQLEARPVSQITSPWQTAKGEDMPTLEKLKGTSYYTAHSGVAVDPYGVYLIRPNDVVGNQVLFANAADLGDTPVEMITATVESDLVYPAVRGKDLSRWRSMVEIFVIITNHSPKKEDQISEAEMRREYPHAYEYLNRFKRQLLSRGKLWAFYGKDTNVTKIPADAESRYYRRKRTSTNRAGKQRIVQLIEVPFYAMRDIGPYSFATHKVVWQMGASRIKAAVLVPISTEWGLRPILPCTGTVSYVACSSLAEAHFLCAFMNSELANLFFSSFSSAGRGMGAPSILKQIQIPAFKQSEKLHRFLSGQSAICHAAGLKRDIETIRKAEAKINEAVASIWHVNAE
ncbi:MAG TPA: N-6 DNA methylase [Pyrinomonadaceae bacterium]|nr:N-6 DNA methylase [Pyrinomonadaceae bacterium]